MEIDPRIKKIVDNIEKVILGKREIILLSLVPLIAEGHLIYIDVPGVGKTTLGESIARSIDVATSRIQFTADLLPTDIIGITVFNKETSQFEFRKGPIFANIVIGDEINRAPPKTQSALLEGMSERTVSVENKRYSLPNPFIVIATENPVEFAGTYPLPESELDRFMLSLEVGYPEPTTEIKILQNGKKLEAKDLNPVLSLNELMDIISEAKEVLVEESVLNYIYEIVRKTRMSKFIRLGLSTRGAIDFVKAVKAFAKIMGRNFVIPEDVKKLAKPVLKHRLIFKEYEEKFKDEIIENIVFETQVPI
ncbi:AAA family ATPase [Caldisericum exile]|uniref:ATPase n=1 Tax=Caldisericum exile (strain DSM 21853 / NBRC 104410 / AZM16c01) TaxID=511051 RepID=A0A7U6GF11_CALEA|nr:MoxR family ATPase [Caldisericum exile]BAL81117.1 putative ATPase [Caldisericum exile AZM16c01]